jgi:ADP-ribosylation factor related protein 1
LRAAGLNIGRIDASGAAVVLWDLGGAAPLRSIWDKYFAESHALMCVAPALPFYTNLLCLV